MAHEPADPLDRIALICAEQPHDALEQIAQVLGFPPEGGPDAKQQALDRIWAAAHTGSNPDNGFRRMAPALRAAIEASRAPGVKGTPSDQPKGGA